MRMALRGSSGGGGGKLLLCLLLVSCCTGAAGQGLRVGFYQQSCPDAEYIVRNMTWAAAAADPSLASKLLRVFFHDCFPQGCDASVLLDGRGTEKASGPNRSLGGLEVIDAAKAALERSCPGTVSCTDAVSFQFGRLLWQVETGRRDSRFSDEDDGTKLTNPEFVFPIVKESFARRGLGFADLVAHTLGLHVYEI